MSDNSLISVGKSIDLVYSNGNMCNQVYSLGELIWEYNEYVDIDWVRSTGQQYIDLEYTPDPTSGKTEIIAITQNPLGTTGLWGFISQLTTTNRTSIGISGGYWYAGVHTNTVTSHQANDGELVHIIYDRTNNTLTINDIVTQLPEQTNIANLTAYLFALNDGRGGTYGTGFTGKVLLFKEYDINNELIIDCVPKLRVIDSKPGLLCNISGKFYVNSGAGELLYTDAIPDTYTLLEYIECDGRQWIDTGLPNTMDLIFDDEFMIHHATTPLGDGNWIIGGRLNYNYGLCVFFGANNRFFNAYGASTYAYTSNITINKWVTMYFSRFELYTTVDGIQKSYTVRGQKLIPLQYETNVLLCKNQVNYSNTGNDPRNMYGKRRYTKITNATTGEVLREFVPVYAAAAKVSGMLDIANDKFYPSIGLADFIPGPIKEI